MKAWQFHGPGQNLVLAEVPIPEPAEDEVLIHIKAAGLCHTDVGIMGDPGWLPRLAPPPLTLGHEFSGVVTAVGREVSDVLIGDRVGVTPAGRTRPGLGRDGGYAQWCTAFPEDLIPIPDSVSFAQAAAGTDAGKTGWHAVVCRGQVQSGNRVVIIGLGGIGQVAARLAVLRGADVTVVEPRHDVWQVARDLGVTEIVENLQGLEGGEFDIAIDFAGTGETTRQAILAVRSQGRVVQVGLSALDTEISMRDLVTRQVSIVGSSGGSTEDIAEIYALMSSGELNPILPTVSFEEVPEGLARVGRGEVVGRLVAVYDG